MKNVAQKPIARPLSAVAEHVAEPPTAPPIAEHLKMRRARETPEYARVFAEKVDGSAGEMSLAGLFAYSTGTCEWDPIAAMLQEIPLRLRTLRAAMKTDEEYALSEDDVDMQLCMLERHAEAVEELYSRVASAPRPTVEALRDINAAAEE